MGVVIFVNCLTVPALLAAAAPQEFTLQQVAKANSAALHAIHSLHVTIAVSNNLMVPGEEKSPKEAQPTYVFEWYKDGPHERVGQIWLRGRGPNSFDVHSYDRSNEPKGLKTIHNYDPHDPPPLSESFSGHAHGELDRTQSDDALGGPGRAMCYMAPFTIGDGTLEAYVSKQPASKLAATPATSKLGCYEITTLEEKQPGPGAGYDVKDIRIFVDPKMGFWIRRIEKGPWQKSTDPGDKGTTIIEVQEFKDCGDGIFWPVRAYHRTRLPGGTSGPDIFVHHVLHSINQPLPEEDFEISFPDWLVVHDRRSGRVFLWGPDDKPRKTFASQAEFEAWDRKRLEAHAETVGIPPRTRWAWLTGISVAVALLLLALIAWRRRTQRGTGVTPFVAEK